MLWFLTSLLTKQEKVHAQNVRDRFQWTKRESVLRLQRYSSHTQTGICLAVSDVSNQTKSRKSAKQRDLTKETEPFSWSQTNHWLKDVLLLHSDSKQHVVIAASGSFEQSVLWAFCRSGVFLSRLDKTLFVLLKAVSRYTYIPKVSKAALCAGLGWIVGVFMCTSNTP